MEAKRYRRGARWIPFFVLGFSLATTLIGWFVGRLLVREGDEKAFHSVVLNAEANIDDRIKTQINLAVSTSAFVGTSEHVTQAAFDEFLHREKWPSDLGAIGSIGYSARVPRAQVADLTRMSKEAGIVGFKAQPLAGVGFVDAVLLADPRKTGPGSGPPGFNMYSQPPRREAMDLAERTGKPAATGKIQLRADPSPNPAIIVFVPVFKPNSGTLTGFGFTAIRIKEALLTYFSDPERSQCTVTIYDGAKASPDNLLYSNDLAGHPWGFAESSLDQNLSRVWTINFHSNSWFEQNRAEPLFTLLPIGGLLVSLLLYLVTSSVQREVQERARAEEEIRNLNEDLESLVDVRTRDLQTAIQELEAFAYSVSHDLRAPLRSVDGFSKALIEDYGDRLDEDGIGYLHRVRAASRRMDELITALLTLSRLTRAEINPQPVNVSELATSLADEYNASGRYQFSAEPDLVVSADPRMVRALLDNLIGNAFKFSGNVQRPEVQFGREGEAFFVRDNGAGFNPQYANKLFKPFERLHTDREFPGSGIGLATAARIVRRHGGEIWAASEPGQGATFYFTLGSV